MRQSHPTPAAIAGLAVTLVSTALGGLGFPPLVWFTVLAVGLLLLLYAAYLRWTQPPATAPVLAEQAAQLSRELYEFLGERRRDEPEYESPPAGLSEDAQRLHWQQRTNRSSSHFYETMTRFQQRYSTRALAIFDLAVQAGQTSAADRWAFEGPTNLFGIEAIAQVLGTISTTAVN